MLVMILMVAEVMIMMICVMLLVMILMVAEVMIMMICVMLLVVVCFASINGHLSTIRALVCLFITYQFENFSSLQMLLLLTGSSDNINKHTICEVVC